MLTAMFLRPLVIRNTLWTPDGPNRLIHLRLDMVLHTISAKDVPAARDGNRKIHEIFIHADHTME
jgi:hypothetical protein